MRIRLADSAKNCWKQAVVKMAAKPDNLVQVTVNFEGNRSVLHLPKNMKIGLAIQKAAEQFKQDPRGLTFLYHGLEITDDMTVGVRG